MWTLPVVVGALALALLAVINRYIDAPTDPVAGHSLPPSPVPQRLADGSIPEQPPAVLEERFAEPVVLSRRLDVTPEDVEAACRRPYHPERGPAIARLQGIIDSAEVTAVHVGHDALTHLATGSHPVPPGYPSEIAIACVAQPVDGGWETVRRPLIDFALHGRAGAGLGDGDLRTRLAEVPVGASWLAQPRGGWWLVHEVEGSPWALVTLPQAVGDNQVARVLFLGERGQVIEDRNLGPTASAADADHSLDRELIAGDVTEVLRALEEGPQRVCAPEGDELCVWLALEEREVIAYAGFGPHPLDTPPLGYVGYCEPARLLQGSVTSAQFRRDGTWAGGPIARGLDRYGVRFETGQVVIDLSEHAPGPPAEGEPVEGRPRCTFTNHPTGVVEE